MKDKKNVSELIQEVRAFTEEYIMPYADQFDQEGKLSAEVVEALKVSGYLGCMIPKEYGGLGLDNVSIGQIVCEMGQACSSTRSIITVHGMVALAILRWGTEEQKEYYLPKMAKGDILASFALSEPEAGSDASSIQCEAEATANGFLINGTKKWITMSQISDIYLVFARCKDRPTAFIVDSSNVGITIEPIHGLMGGKASMMSEIRFKDCYIPEDHMLGSIGRGISHVALYSLEFGRYTVAWGAVGMCKRCLTLCLQYSRKRRQGNVPIRKYQLVQKMITEMEVYMKASELMCIHAGELLDSHDPDAIINTWNAKYFTSKAVKLVTDNAVQIFGANGCVEGSVVERFYRDAKIMEIIEGSSQIHEILIASNCYIS